MSLLTNQLNIRKSAKKCHISLSTVTNLTHEHLQQLKIGIKSDTFATSGKFLCTEKATKFFMSGNLDAQCLQSSVLREVTGTCKELT